MIEELLQYTALSEDIINNREYLQASQIGYHVSYLNDDGENFEKADIVILGCGEMRRQNENAPFSDGPDKIRKELYEMQYWHPEINMLDIGNIIPGATVNDTDAALKLLLSELHEKGKKVLILGGSHDLTVQQYQSFKSKEVMVDFTIIDMLADVKDSGGVQYDNYLLESLTSTPNFVRTFNLIGFQSYYVNPQIIQTFDKLRFDCIRLGKVRENIEAVEPIFRNSTIVSFDINCVKYSDAPANKLASPNGFTGDEICKLTRYAGMSSDVKSIGIYGYLPTHDHNNLTAKLIAQMIWYYIDGLYVAKNEASLENKELFLNYHVPFNEYELYFLKSKKTNRWWMVLPNGKAIACTYQDYITASNNELPERWLREMERNVTL